MALLQLNDDILAIIMSHTRPDDASRFAQFEKDPRRSESDSDDSATQGRDRSETGLADGTSAHDSGHIEVAPDYQIAKFCRLILADIPGRASHVRAIFIYDRCGPPSETTGIDTEGHLTCVHLLCEVLRHTVRITDVKLDDMDYILEEYRTLAIAIAQLPNVQSFTLILTHIAMIPWPQIAFQPRKLMFRVGCDQSEPRSVESEIKAFYQMLALPNVSGHTEYLDVDFCEHLLETAAANNAIALPSIRTLKIRDVRPSTLAIAARLFPDVRALNITHTGRDDYSTVYRLASGWSRLDTVTVRRVYSPSNVPTALGPHVRCLCVEADHASAFCMTSTLSLLERTSPVVLAIRTIHPLRDAESASELQQCVKAAPELKFLQIEFSQSGSRYAQWSRWIEITQASSLRQSRLIGMLLSTKTFIATSSRDECPMIAKGFATQILTLQYVGFRSIKKGFPGEANRDWSIWYRVKRKEGGGEPVLQELLPEEGYLIHRELLATHRC